MGDLMSSKTEPTRFTVRIELGNEAMRTPADVAGALRKLASKLEQSDVYDHTIRDENGNTIGESEAED